MKLMIFSLVCWGMMTPLDASDTEEELRELEKEFDEKWRCYQPDLSHLPERESRISTGNVKDCTKSYNHAIRIVLDHDSQLYSSEFGA